MKLLIVDDDRALRDALRRVLNLAGYEVVATAAGLEALGLLAELAPDALILDIGLPDVSGLEVCRRLRAQGQRLPVLMLTARDAVENRIDGLDAGADDYLVKPFDIGELIARIRALLRRSAPDDGAGDPSGERESLRRDVIVELDELTGLVSDLVELARGAKPSAALDEVRLDELVRAAVTRAQRRAERISFRVEVEPTLVSGDARRIDRAVANLLDNALKWSPPDGDIDVILHDGLLSVRDRGPGFADGDLPSVFARFYRADGARGKPGSGLGLAIVKQAAEAHGGRVEAANAPGGGARVAVTFGAPTQLLQSPDAGLTHA
jgi:DNA-binding response OmpR family regulator